MIQEENAKKQYKNNAGRNNFVFCIILVAGILFAFGYIGGAFAWIHDLNIELEHSKAEIDQKINAEHSCSNLATFIKPYEQYWDQPYAIKKAKERMVELHC